MLDMTGKSLFPDWEQNISCKISEKLEGDTFKTLKEFSKKISHSDEKIERGDPLVFSAFVGYVKKVKNEMGPFALSLHWPDLA